MVVLSVPPNRPGETCWEQMASPFRLQEPGVSFFLTLEKWVNDAMTPLFWVMTNHSSRVTETPGRSNDRLLDLPV